MATDVVKQPITRQLGERTRSDVKHPRGRAKPVRFVRQLVGEARSDNLTDIGAMMAYYAVLSLFPMVLFVISLAMLVLDASTVQQGVAMATETMPASTRELIAKQVASFMAASNAGFAIGGAALALWGASRGALSLGTALNSIFNKQESRSWVRRNLTAIGVTFGVALLIVVALGLLVVGPTLGHYASDRFGLGNAFDVAWGVGRWVGAGLLVMVVWAIVYRFLPDTHAPFRVFTPGAFVGVLAWVGISLLFGLYLDHWNSYDKTYGALGTGIIFLTWLWLSNMALLFGAEINDVLADFRKHASPAAAQLARETRPD
jgi:membrane protein